MSKITISADHTADLGYLQKEYDIKTITMGVVIGDDVYRCSEVTHEQIFKAVEIDNLVPKTNAGLEIDYRELFEKATENGGSIIHYSISDKLSASHANARRAAVGLDRVYIVDSKKLSVGTGALAIKAKELVNAGKSAEEIVKTTTAMVEKVDVGFIVHDLKYLYRGGRVSGLKLLGANALKIRPSMIMSKDGRLVPDKKLKGDFAKAAREYIQYKISSNPNADKSVVYLARVAVNENLIQDMIDDLKSAGFEKVILLHVGATMTTHCGRSTVGIVIVNK